MAQKVNIPLDQVKMTQTINRLRTVYEGGIPDRVPLLFNVSDQSKPQFKIPPYSFLDHAQSLEAAAMRIRQRLACFPEGDYYPWVWAGEPLAYIPSLFGAKIELNSNGIYEVHGHLIEDLKRDLPRLPERVNPDHDGLGPQVKERLLYFAEATGRQIPIFPFDWQSPYCLASQLMGDESLMFAMYDEPELVERLFARVTDATIDTIKAAIRWLGDPRLCLLNNQVYYAESGITLHDDYVSVLSPKLYSRFCVPSNRKIYETFGYGHLHTCGPFFPGYLDSIIANKGVHSTDVHFVLRELTRTREDLIAVKHQLHAAGMTMVTNPTWFLDTAKRKPAPYERDLFFELASGGGLILNWFGVEREQALILKEWAEECYR